MVSIDPVSGQRFAAGVAAAEFEPSVYHAVKSTSTSAASEALAAGVTRVACTNMGNTLANYILIAFGADTTEAEANLANGGNVVMPHPAPARVFRVPRTAGAIAWKSAAGTPDLSLEPGK